MGDVAQPHDAPGGVAGDGDFAQPQLVFALGERAQLALRRRAADFAGRQIAVLLAHADADLAQSGVHFDELAAVDFDPYLLFGQPQNFDPGDAQTQQLGFEAAREAAQFRHVAAENRHPRDVVVYIDFAHARRFGFFGQIARDLVDQRFRLFLDFDEIDFVGKLQIESRGAFAGDGGEFFDVGRVAQFVFERDDDRFLDLFGARARPGDRDDDKLQLESRKKTGVEFRQRPTASDESEQHQQIRRHPMAGERLDNRADRAHQSSACNSAPSTRLGTRVATIFSPSTKRGQSSSATSAAESSPAVSPKILHDTARARRSESMR